jgi:hypothetical protein
MKKIAGIGLLAMAFSFQSCKEKGVTIDMSEKKDIIDTTYVAVAEKAELRKVLIEEFTGASCTNCPEGHDKVKAIQTANPDRVVAVAYHTFFLDITGSIFRPVKELGGITSKYDFRDSAATDIGKAIYGSLNDIPKAGIDRTFSGSGTMPADRQLGRAIWPTQTNTRLAIAPPANLHLTSTYDAAKNEVSLNIKVAYTKSVATKNVLTIGVAESKIIDAQKFPEETQADYEHNHVLRKFLTPFNGNAVIDSIGVKEPGRVYEYNLKFTPSEKWKLENCTVFAFLSNNEADNKEVLQAAEVSLK